MLLSESDWDRQTVVKLKGAFNTMRLAVPHMIEQGGGSFINVASDAWVGMVNAAAYSASNAGLVGLTRSCAAELFHYNINVNAICPQAASPGHVSGFTKTLLTLEKSDGGGGSICPKKSAKRWKPTTATPKTLRPSCLPCKRRGKGEDGRRVLRDGIGSYLLVCARRGARRASALCAPYGGGDRRAHPQVAAQRRVHARFRYLLDENRNNSAMIGAVI